jgi:hypothetical protein
MGSVATRLAGRALIIAAALSGSTASAEVFRGTVIVEKPVAAGSSLAATRMIEARARRTLVETYIRERLSGVFLGRRSQEVRDALEPLDALLGPLTVASRSDVDEGQVRVICYADIDAAAVVLRLVQSNILSFGSVSPRLLLLPAGRTRPESLRGLRVRLSEGVRSVGVTLLADEALSIAGASGNGRGGTDDRVSMMKAALDSGAHYVALTTVTATRAPSVAGAVLDATIQYTLLRPYDSAIVAEQTFNGRGSGPSEEAALQVVLTELAPAMAKGLSGRLAESIFRSGRAIDPELPVQDVHINVMRRPNASATSALMGLLRERAFPVALASGRVATGERAIADRLTIHGKATVEDVFDLLANTRFGKDDALQTMILEHGADSLSVELVDVHSFTTPVRRPAAEAPAARPVPVSNLRPVPTAAPVAIRRSPRPLEFEFSAAFLQATLPDARRK